jgi:hypothetical protein
MGKASRRKKSLALKVQHLRLEIEEREEEIKDAEEAFLKELAAIDCEDIVKKSTPPSSPQVVINDSSHDNGEDLEVEKAPDGPEEMKQLWRSIAIVTHPDKTGGDPEKDDLYKRANSAWNKREYSKLVQIALELGIDPPDTENSIALLEEMTHDLEKVLKETENSVLWEWSQAAPEAKKRIIDLYLLSKGKRRKE